ncbi:MAG: thioredoxin family protein [Phycisphaeraceae bacterium]|nr:thioredoxin family protein [Phycisphaeraceae bacterium]MCB9848302.1 thioredoxin family protein [Phycisphaeraceae bacterium]
MSTATTPHVLDAEFLESKHHAGLSFDAYVATAKPEKQQAWRAVYDKITLTEPQKSLIGSFTRPMRVLVTSGVWCGDCVQQCPLLERIAEASDLIDLKFVDRDEHADLSQRIQICQGLRVPTVVFMAEDYEFIGLMGDRSLTRYRAMAAQQLGAHCPLPGAPIPTDELRATMQDWLNEFERLQLLLRLSPRLRQKHGD